MGGAAVTAPRAPAPPASSAAACCRNALNSRRASLTPTKELPGTIACRSSELLPFSTTSSATSSSCAEPVRVLHALLRAQQREGDDVLDGRGVGEQHDEVVLVEAEAELDVAGNTLTPTCKYTKGIRLGREEIYLGKNRNLVRKQHYAQKDTARGTSSRLGTGV